MGVFRNFVDDRLDFLLRGTIIDGGHRVATKSLTSPLLVPLDFPPSREKMATPFSRECLQGPR